MKSLFSKKGDDVSPREEKQKCFASSPSELSLGSLGFLPLELREMIFSYFTAKELCQLGTISQDWLALTESDALWRALYYSDFASYERTIAIPDCQWKLAYQKQHETATMLLWGSYQSSLTVDGMKCHAAKSVGPWKTAITTNGFSSGIHYWEVKVLKHYPAPSIISIRIGILKKSALNHTSINNVDCIGWICGRSLSYCRMLAPRGDVTYDEGDVIGVLLNLEGPDHWMGYYKNGQFLGKCCEFVKDTDGSEVEVYYPAVSLDYGGEVELCPKGLLLSSVQEEGFSVYQGWKDAGGKLPAAAKKASGGFFARLLGFVKSNN